MGGWRRASWTQFWHHNFLSGFGFLLFYWFSILRLVSPFVYKAIPEPIGIIIQLEFGMIFCTPATLAAVVTKVLGDAVPYKVRLDYCCSSSIDLPQVSVPSGDRSLRGWRIGTVLHLRQHLLLPRLLHQLAVRVVVEDGD